MLHICITCLPDSTAFSEKDDQSSLTYEKKEKSSEDILYLLEGQLDWITLWKLKDLCECILVFTVAQKKSDSQPELSVWDPLGLLFLFARIVSLDFY